MHILPTILPFLRVIKNLFVGDNLVLPKTSGKGIQVDVDAPTFGWRDLEGRIVYRDVGVGSPTLATFQGNIRGLNFAAGDDYDLYYHIPHDFLPNSDMFIHLHWAHNGTDISGSLVVNYYVTYAKGHYQAVYPAEKNITQTVGSLAIGSHAQYGHFLDEVQLSTSGGSATLLDSTLIEPDGLIKIHFDVTTIPTITGGSTKPFIDYVDIHIQSTGIGTKQKAPSFYT